MSKIRGKVKWFNKEKGFGFVTGEDSNDYFIHQRDVSKEYEAYLTDGRHLEFEPFEKEKGLCVSKVELLEDIDNVDSFKFKSYISLLEASEIPYKTNKDSNKFSIAIHCAPSNIITHEFLDNNLVIKSYNGFDSLDSFEFNA